KELRVHVHPVAVETAIIQRRTPGLRDSKKQKELIARMNRKAERLPGDLQQGVMMALDLQQKEPPPEDLKQHFAELLESESKLAFEDKGNVMFYYLPAENLTKAGITDRNQPFEMDEIEFRLGPNDHIAGYRFKPLAKVTDAFPEAVSLDQEYKEKLQVILH